MTAINQTALKQAGRAVFARKEFKGSDRMAEDLAHTAIIAYGASADQVDGEQRAAAFNEVLDCRTFGSTGEYRGWNITKLNQLVGNTGARSEAAAGGNL